MKPWNKLFNRSDKSSNTAEFSRLTVDLDELIKLRFQSAALDFSSTLSRSKKAFSTLSGGHLSPFKGRGLDFDEVRPYQAGDDIRNIDWNVTARTNKVHTKVFKEERERPVFIIADYRNSMHFATRGSLKSVQAARFAALSAWIAADHHNRVGGMVFTDNQQIELRPKAGYKGVLKLLRLLGQSHQPTNSPPPSESKSEQENNQHQSIANDPAVLFMRLKKIIKPGSLIIFISDFRFINADNINLMHSLSRQNDFIASFVYDPLEVELPPPGQYAVTSARDSVTEKSQFTSIDTSQTQFRQDYRRQFLERDSFLEQGFNKMGIHFVRLASNNNVTDIMKKFLGHSTRTSRTAKSRA
ncbi:MAG: DUF58 domain-containing protein [Pseudomonadota bacterium]